MDLIIKLIKGEKITEDDIKNELYEICDREHYSCNSNCPVYYLNKNSIPDTRNAFDCDYFKSGSKMLEFIRNKIK
jgi:hypothetical protein